MINPFTSHELWAPSSYCKWSFVGPLKIGSKYMAITVFLQPQFFGPPTSIPNMFLHPKDESQKDPTHFSHFFLWHRFGLDMLDGRMDRHLPGDGRSKPTNPEDPFGCVGSWCWVLAVGGYTYFEKITSNVLGKMIPKLMISYSNNWVSSTTN